MFDDSYRGQVMLDKLLIEDICRGQSRIFGRGYPHDGRADKRRYPHDGRADKRRYRPDRRADSQCYRYWLSARREYKIFLQAYECIKLLICH